MRNWVLGAAIVSGIIAGGVFLYMNSGNETADLENTGDAIRYLPVGDSYTIGNGVSESGRWPNVLVKHLNEAGVKIQIIGNPAVSGYTVEDAALRELPVVERMKPNFVTVLIGANDNFSGTAPEVYEKELSEFLDELQALMQKPENVVLVTIPDYSYSPASEGYSTEGVSESIKAYNEIIKSEASKRNLPVADIFEVSQTMTGSEDYISDGLHPSALGYSKWEKIIYPVVFEFLKK